MDFDREALNSLYPEGWRIFNGELFINNVKTSNTEKDKKVAALQAEYDALQYQRDRATSFPSIGDQLDMQYHDELNGTTTWKDAVAKVKADNPKPE